MCNMQSVRRTGWEGGKAGSPPEAPSTNKSGQEHSPIYLLPVQWWEHEFHTIYSHRVQLSKRKRHCFLAYFHYEDWKGQRVERKWTSGIVGVGEGAGQKGFLPYSTFCPSICRSNWGVCLETACLLSAAWVAPLFLSSLVSLIRGLLDSALHLSLPLSISANDQTGGNR